MCFVETPYYNKCGHYGLAVISPYGRCARAEHLPGPCWEPQNLGLKSLDETCKICERLSKEPPPDNIILVHGSRDDGEPTWINVERFNQLMRLHKESCDKSESVICNASSTASSPDTRRPSTASQASTTSNLSTRGRPRILTIEEPRSDFRFPTWNSVSGWNDFVDSGKSSDHEESDNTQVSPKH